MGPVDEAVVCLQRALAMAEAVGVGERQLASLRSHLALGQLALGAVDDAEATLAAIPDADGDGQAFDAAELQLVRGALLALRGDRAGARPLLLRSDLADARTRSADRPAAALLAALDGAPAPEIDSVAIRALVSAL
ncbi:MAG: hypothetical protein R3F59_16570 [Myxococcota bacterium]